MINLPFPHELTQRWSLSALDTGRYVLHVADAPSAPAPSEQPPAPTGSVKKVGPPLLTKKPTVKSHEPKPIEQTDDVKVQEQKTGLVHFTH